MQQQVLFDNILAMDSVKFAKVVNVASIPQRSPFRYPGGKTWFVPTLRKWLSSQLFKPKLFIEPFAGGGIISLTVAFENLAEKILMIELDEQVAAVWKTIINGHAKSLAEKILNFDLNRENLMKELGKKYSDPLNIAFQTILKNRTFHGGILAEGSGIIKTGENGKGLLSRWYPATLARRINNISFVSDKIEFEQTDGMNTMRAHANNPKVFFFIDPPYTAGGKCAGSRLYKYCNLNHESLFKLCKTIKGDFVLTYDNSEDVICLAQKYGFEVRTIPMKNTHHEKIMELVIGKNLSWM